MWFNRMVFTRGLETHQNAILLMLFFYLFFFIYGMLHLSSHYCGFILDPAQRHSVTGIEISQELFPEMFLFTSLIFWVCGRNSHSIFHFLVQLRKMPVRHLNLMVSCVTVTFFPRYYNFLAALPAAELILTWAWYKLHKQTHIMVMDFELISPPTNRNGIEAFWNYWKIPFKTK